MNHKIKTFSLLLAGAVAGGCANLENARRDVDNKTAQGYEQAVASQAKITSPALNAEQVFVRQKGSWLGRRTVDISSDDILPEAFSQNVTLAFPGRLNIQTIAERITKVTSIPVRIKPDVFLSPTAFVRSGAGAIQVQQPGTGLPGQPGVQPGMPGAIPPVASVANQSMSLSGAQNFSTDMELNYSGSLAGLLDLVAARIGISWEYKDGGINLFRLITRTMTLKANPGNSDYSSTIGKAGNGGAAISGTNTVASSFSSTAQIKMESKFSVWESTESALKSILSPLGKISVSQATGTITVTDTKDVVEQAQKIVDYENMMLTRQIGIRVEMLSVELGNEAEYGINWNVVYSKLSNLSPLWKLTAASPSTLAGALAGSVGLQIVAPITNDNSLTQRLSGSSALMNALSSIGRTHIVTTASVATLNRQPVPVALTNQVAYLASTAPATAVAGGTGGLPGLTPGTVTTGFMLNLLPTVMENNMVQMQFSVDVSELKKLNTISSGSGATLQSIQTPEVSGTQFLQRVALRAGETLVISGFERQTDQYDKRTLTEDGPIGLGGSYTGNKKREATVILITPVIMEGV